MSTDLNMEYQEVKFGDICREVKLTTKDPIADGYDKYIGLEHLDSGSLKIKRWGLIAEDNPTFTRVFKKGHILIGKRRPYLKKAAIAEFDGVCSGDIIVVEADQDNIFSKNLPFLIHSEKFWDKAIETSSGSLSPRTKFTSLKEIKFKLNEKGIDELFQTLSKLEEVLLVTEIAISKIENFIDNYLLEKLVYQKSEQKLLLGDVIKESRNRPSTDENYEKYVGFEHIRPLDSVLNDYEVFNGDISGKQLFDINQILFGKIRPYLKKSVVAKFNGICSGDLLVLDAIDENQATIFARFFQTEYFVNIAMKSAKGSKMPRADWGYLSKEFINDITDQVDVVSKVLKSNLSIKNLLETKQQKLYAIRAELLKDI